MLRCELEVWYVLLGHATQLRAATVLSAEMSLPCPHAVCSEHVVRRWLVLTWNVLAPHSEHVRAEVVVFAEMSSPAPHVGCSVHEVSR